MLALSPEGHDDRRQVVPVHRMTVGDRQASSRHEPVGSASVSHATPVGVEDPVFDIGAGDAKELHLCERVVGSR
jgi:hypothetical protein